MTPRPPLSGGEVPTLESLAGCGLSSIRVLAGELLALQDSLEHPIAGNRIDALEGAVKLLENDRYELKDRIDALEVRDGGDRDVHWRDVARRASLERTAAVARAETAERERDQLREAAGWSANFKVERDAALSALRKIAVGEGCDRHARLDGHAVCRAIATAALEGKEASGG